MQIVLFFFKKMAFLLFVQSFSKNRESHLKKNGENPKKSTPLINHLINTQKWLNLHKISKSGLAVCKVVTKANSLL